MFPSTRTHSADKVHPAFQDFMTTYSRGYETEHELRTRQKIFLHNRAYVQAGNRKNTFRMAINHLADHTEEEMNRRRGIAPTGSKGHSLDNEAGSTHKASVNSAKELPTSWDWRSKGAVTEVQDQGVCGSCWSFGSTGTIEGAYFLKYGSLHVFSQQELMDCSWNFGNNACDGGEDFRAYQWIMQNGGFSFKDSYGSYLMADDYCKAGVTSPDVQIASYVNITSGDETALLDAIVNQGPISVAIDASHKSLSFYAEGVYYEPDCANNADGLDHAVLAVGFGTDSVGGDYWIIKNSWSTHYGQNGYMWMSRNNNNCGVATSATYVILQ
jgi:C1A family cysteine protease